MPEGNVEGNVISDPKPDGKVSSCARLDRQGLSNLIAVPGNIGGGVRTGPGDAAFDC